MQRNRGNRNPFFDIRDPFAGFDAFGGFGGQRSLFSNFFGGRDPFDDPFFKSPFGGMFEPSIFGPSGNLFPPGPASGFLEHHHRQPTASRGPIIEELNSDDEGEQEGKDKEKKRKLARSTEGPFIEDPDDVTEGRSKQVQYKNDCNRVINTRTQPQTHSFTFQSSSVSYGGANGAYYTSSRTRRSGSDGLTFEEAKEADTATGQASHRISRGIHDKGHSVNRKLNSDGRVDTMQMLHNLNEEELSGFDEAWSGNARKYLPGWNEGFNVNAGGQMETGTRGGWALPSTERVQRSGNMRPSTDEVTGTSRPQFSGRAKANVGHSKATSFNRDHAMRR